MCVAITAIDSAQLAMDLALVGVLKKAVKTSFKLLTSGIKLATQTWTLPLLKTKLREWKIENEILEPQMSEKAHFTPTGRGRAPNSFKNRQANQQREPRKDSGGAKMFDFECWNCKKKGHRAKDCHQPKREDNDRGGEKRNQTSSSYSGDYESGGDSRRARRDNDGDGEKFFCCRNLSEKEISFEIEIQI